MLRVCLGLLGGLLLTQTLPAGQAGLHTELIGGTLPELAAIFNAEVNLGYIDALILRSGHEEVVIPYGKINSLASSPVMAFARMAVAALCTHPCRIRPGAPSPSSIEEAGLRQLRTLRRVLCRPADWRRNPVPDA